MKFNVVVIGLGKIGMEYDLHLDSESYILSHVRAFDNHENFELVCGVDINESLRSIFTNNYKKPAYPTIKAALSLHAVDIVVISTPTEHHLTALMEVLKDCRPKIILCEKPLAYKIDEANEIINRCELAGVSLFVNYMRRSDPGVISIKQLIDKGTLKKPIKSVVWYTKGFIHNGSHFFNLLEFWLGSYKNSVLLAINKIPNPEDSEVDLHIDFSKGSAIFVSAWDQSFSHYSIELLSPSGRIKYDSGGSLITFENRIPDPINESSYILNSVPVYINNNMNKYQQSVVEELNKFINGEGYNLCSGKEALHTLESMLNAVKDKF